MATYTLTTGTDIFPGSAGADNFIVTPSTLTTGDSIGTAGQADSIQLVGDGTYDFRAVSVAGISIYTFIGSVVTIYAPIDSGNATFLLGNNGSTFYGGSGSEMVELSEYLSDGPDLIDLGAGKDTITAGAGYDFLGDTLIGGAGDDEIVFKGSAFDLTRAASINGFETFTLTSGSNTLTVGSHTLNDVSTINFGSGTDVLRLASSFSTLDLSAITLNSLENITLLGAGSTVTLGAVPIGLFSIVAQGSGNKLVVTSGGINLNSLGVTAIQTVQVTDSAGATLVDTAAAHTLLGGSGNDTITGGGGADTITGGAGLDTFTDTAARFNGVTITDWEMGESIVVTDLAFESGDVNLTGSTLSFESTVINVLGVAGRAIELSAEGGGTGTRITLVAPTPSTTGSSLTFSADTGTSGIDLITNTVVQQAISGNLTAALLPSESVQISLNGGGTWISATASAGSQWTLNNVTLGASGVLQVRVINADGKYGPVYDRPYTVDTAAPSVTVSSNVASIARGGDATITLTLSEPGQLTLSDLVVTGGTLGNLTGGGTLYTLVATPQSNSTIPLTVAVKAGAFVDVAGNTNTASATLSIAVNTLTQPTPTPEPSPAFLFGTGGQDILSGGPGNDRLDGGLGWDIALQSGNRADYSLTQEANALVLTHKTTGVVDHLKSVEMIKFDTGASLYIADSDAEAAAAHIATRWLGRDLTAEEGAEFQPYSQLTPLEVAQAVLRGPHASALQGHAAEELVAGWQDNIQILRMNVVSEVVQGSAGNDAINYGLLLAGTRLQWVSDGVWEGTELKTGAMAELRSIERVHFSDASVALDGSTLAALIAVTLGEDSLQDRAITSEGLALMDSGWSSQSIGTAALQLAMGPGAHTAQETVQWLWTKAHGSAGTAEQLLPYAQKLEAGTATAGDLALEAAQYALLHPQVGLAGVLQQGLVYDAA